MQPSKDVTFVQLGHDKEGYYVGAASEPGISQLSDHFPSIKKAQQIVRQTGKALGLNPKRIAFDSLDKPPARPGDTPAARRKQRFDTPGPKAN